MLAAAHKPAQYAFGTMFPPTEVKAVAACAQNVSVYSQVAVMPELCRAKPGLATLSVVAPCQKGFPLSQRCQFSVGAWNVMLYQLEAVAPSVASFNMIDMLSVIPGATLPNACPMVMYSGSMS